MNPILRRRLLEIGIVFAFLGGVLGRDWWVGTGAGLLQLPMCVWFSSAKDSGNCSRFLHVALAIKNYSLLDQRPQKNELRLRLGKSLERLNY